MFHVPTIRGGDFSYTCKNVFTTLWLFKICSYIVRRWSLLTDGFIFYVSLFLHEFVEYI